MKKRVNKLKISILILTCLLVGAVTTALGAVLPRAPFSVTAQAELEHLTFGFPIKFIEQSLDADQVSELVEKGFNTSFILPRYDRYVTAIRPVGLVLNVLIWAAAAALVFAMITFLPRLTKKITVFLLIGLLLCVLSAIFPVPPGTFKTVEDLQPARFGFALKFIEQTPDVNQMLTLSDHDLQAALAGAFWTPKIFFGNVAAYTTHIRGWLLALSVPLNALIAAAVYNLFILIRAARRHAIAQKYAECVNRLILEPLPAGTPLPRWAQRIRQLQQTAPAKKRPKKKF